MFDSIKGKWPKHNKFIMCSCDSKYFNKFFPRFYQTFSKHWKLPIHVHLIDPTKVDLQRLDTLSVSHTYCTTQEYDWSKSIKMFKFAFPGYALKPDSTVREWLYECYCQCQRFVVMGSHIHKSQSVCIADVDCYAINRPNKKEIKHLFSNTSLSLYKGRIMATFGNYNGKDKDLFESIKNEIISTSENSFVIGLDQKVLKKVLYKEMDKFTTLSTKYIWHDDVHGNDHDKCLVFHQKGTRGKNQEVKVGWTDIK